MVKLYSDHCPSCKMMRPNYEIVAEALAEVDSVIIGKMNDKNHNRAIFSDKEWEATPTLKLWPGKDKHSPVEMTPKGGHSFTPEGFIRFIHKHSNGGFDLERVLKKLPALMEKRKTDERMWEVAEKSGE